MAISSLRDSSRRAEASHPEFYDFHETSEIRYFLCVYDRNKGSGTGKREGMMHLERQNNGGDARGKVLWAASVGLGVL